MPITKQYLKSLSKYHRIPISNTLKQIIVEHFADNYYYTEQDIFEQSRKIIENYTIEIKK